MQKFSELLKREGPILGLYISLPTPDVVEAAKYAGFDFIRIDMEHGVPNPGIVAEMIRTANLLDLHVQVRISRLTDITWLLDCGADGIVVPDVTSCDIAREAIRFTKTYPLGNRGMYPPCRPTKFGTTSFKDYLAVANDVVTLAVQIEDKDTVTRLDDILSLEGIDMVSSGKADLAQSIGSPGNFRSSQVLALEDEIIHKAILHGKTPCIMAGSPARAQELLEMGVRALTLGPDIFLFAGCLHDLVARYRPASESAT